MNKIKNFVDWVLEDWDRIFFAAVVTGMVLGKLIVVII